MERDLWVADWDRTMLACPKCGGDRDECKDAEKVWHLWRKVCHKTAALAAARRIHDEEYKSEPWSNEAGTKRAKEFSEATPFHYLDGVSLWVADKPQHPPPPDAD